MKRKTLAEICEINPKYDHALNSIEQCSFVPMEFVDDVFAEISRTEIRRISEVQKGYTPFRDGDVILAKITPCLENGKCALVANLTNATGFGSTEFHVLRAGDSVIPKWLYYFVRQESVRTQLKRQMHGSAGQQRVPSDAVERLEIPLPSLPEQQRIAALLDRADHLRRTRRYAQQLSDSFLQAVFVKMFGDLGKNSMQWEIETLSDIQTEFDYGTSAKCHTDEMGLPVLRIPNILHGYIDMEDLKYAELPKREKEKLLLRQGELIFVRTNGNADYVGRCAVFNLERDCLFASYLIRAKLNLQKLDPVFAVSYLQSPSGRRGMFPFIRTTAGQSNIGTEGLGQIQVPLPPLSLQQKFARIVQQFERLRAQQREAERQAEHLFQTLLHIAFNQKV